MPLDNYIGQSRENEETKQRLIVLLQTTNSPLSLFFIYERGFMYTIEEIKNRFKQDGYTIIGEIPDNYNCKYGFECKDSDGYFVNVSMDKLINKSNPSFAKIDKSNKHTIDNINLFLNKNNINAVCVDEKYLNSKQRLKFQCECGNYFYTTFSNIRYFHKIKCDKCTGYHNRLTYEEVLENLKNHGYSLITTSEEFSKNRLSDLRCRDKDGYKHLLRYNDLDNHENPLRFNACNPFRMDNVELFLFKNKLPFKCLSTKEDLINNDSVLKFECTRCGEHISKAWRNVYRYYADTLDKDRFGRISCPNCDGSLESIHALVLKQMFLHYHPDTITEEKSCINPKTNYLMPTDIVNHRLKIAIEIQSEWHDNEYSKYKDAYKKSFWINKGYKFYDPDIRDYSILEMCQLFFNIKEIPSFINYSYNKKLNIKDAQDLLNQGCKVKEVAKILDVNIHRIYDALGSKKLRYPEGYESLDKTSVVQLDLNGTYIATYSTLREAHDKTGVLAGNISSCLLNKKNYSSGFYWVYKKDYKEGNYQLKSKLSKYLIPIAKYDMNDNFIKNYNTIIDAGKDDNISNFKIHEVASGERKSTSGYKYKFI